MMNSKKLVKGSIRGQIELQDSEFNSSTVCMALSTFVPAGTEIDEERVSHLGSMAFASTALTTRRMLTSLKSSKLSAVSQATRAVRDSWRSKQKSVKGAMKHRHETGFLPTAPEPIINSPSVVQLPGRPGHELGNGRETSVHIMQQRKTQDFGSGSEIHVDQDLMLSSHFQLLFELVECFDRSKDIEKLRREYILRSIPFAAKLSHFEEMQLLQGEKLTKSEDWVRTQGTVKDPVESFTLTKPIDSSPWLTTHLGKRCVKVDESIEEGEACLEYNGERL